MFKPKYRMTTPTETMVVTLTPTLSTWLKFVVYPTIASVGVTVGIGAYGYYLDRKAQKYNQEHIHPSQRKH